MKIQAPQVSVIVVNYNGKHWLQALLPDLQKQTFRSLEVIVVDNASSDGSAQWIQKNFPQFKLLQNSENVGFAEGNNRGVRIARGKYFIFLNSDTRVGPLYVEEFLEAARQKPKAGVLQSKVLLLDKPTYYDVCGSFWTDTNFLYHYGFQKRVSSVYERAYPIFSGLGASLLVQRSVVNRIGLFDSTFWSYYEETDFCHRAWLAGYECWYVPTAAVLHAKGGTSVQFHNGYIYYHNCKNKLNSYIKNFSLTQLLLVIPKYFFLQIGLSFYFLATKRAELFLATYQAIGWVILHLPEILTQRTLAQNCRLVSDAEIFRRVKKNPRWIYYKLSLTGLEAYKDE